MVLANTVIDCMYFSFCMSYCYYCYHAWFHDSHWNIIDIIWLFHHKQTQQQNASHWTPLLTHVKPYVVVHYIVVNCHGKLTRIIAALKHPLTTPLLIFTLVQSVQDSSQSSVPIYFNHTKSFPHISQQLSLFVQKLSECLAYLQERNNRTSSDCWLLYPQSLIAQYHEISPPSLQILRTCEGSPKSKCRD
jgi:hypothetical protein